MLMNTGVEGGYLWTFCFQARHPALPPSEPQRGGTEKDRGAGGVHVGPKSTHLYCMESHPGGQRASNPVPNLPRCPWGGFCMQKVELP